MDKSWCVYVHTNKSNGKKYVGITSQNTSSRWKDGDGYKRCTLFYRAIQKYSWDGFTHEVLFSGLAESDAKQHEVRLIRELQTQNPEYGYNLTAGGDGMAGCAMPEETKQKISDALVGRFCGANSPHYGRHPSDGAKKKMSDAKKRAYLGEGNPFYGKSHSDETKRKISETKYANGMPSEVPVVCIETGVVYRSISEAGRDTGCDSSSISKCCRGIYRSTHGFSWVYKNYEGGDG